MFEIWQSIRKDRGIRMKLPNGYGSITKLKGKRRKPWRVQAPCKYIEGKEHRKILSSYRTKSEAVKALAVFNNDPTLMNEQPTFEFCFNLWYNKWKEGKAENTTKSINGTREHLKPLMDLQVDRLTLDILQEFFDGLEITPASKKSIYNKVKQVIDYAILNDYCSKSYMKGVNLGKMETKLQRKTFTTEEITNLWKLKGDLFVDILLIQLYTGMRINEVTELKNENIHLDERYMVGGSKTKAGKNRVIPIHKEIEPLIHGYYNSGEYLLKGNYKTVTFSGMMCKKFKELGLDHTSHDARVTFISRMSELDVNLLTVKKIVGHASGNITEDLYTKKSINELVEAIDKLNYK